jgi:hypothetical protein
MNGRDRRGRDGGEAEILAVVVRRVAAVRGFMSGVIEGTQSLPLPPRRVLGLARASPCNLARDCFDCATT